MIWPKLVRDAQTPIHVRVTSEEINEFNERETIVDGDFLCNYQGTANVKYTTDKTAVIVTGKVLIDGDIAPSVGEITGGTVELFGQTREIWMGAKRRNPDGSVNYTELELK